MKKAFTLAEVLITLTIIGVVAALTIPTLTAEIQKRETIAGLQKSFSELAQAVKLSEIDNGDISGWDFTLTSQEFSKNYLTPYIKIEESLAKYTTYSNLKGKVVNSEIAVLSRSGKFKNDTVTFTTTSGITYFIDSWYDDSSTTTKYRGIGVDINGIRRNPNVVGKDFFYILLDSENRVVPGGYDKTRDYLVSKGCSKNCSTNNTDCAGLIFKDGWKISKDYPW